MLVSLGLMTLGVFVGTGLADRNTEFRSKAAERNLQTSSTSCGELPATIGDERSGDGCQLNTKPEVSRECASCITAHQPGFRKWWDSIGNGACNNVQIVSNWRQMEPDGKRNFYHGHTTETGGPCNCFCSRELVNPDVDYGNSPSIPTITSPQIPQPSNPFRLPSIIYEPSPTLLPIPSPTIFEETPPTVSVPTDFPEPSDIISYPTLPSQNTPVPTITPSIPYRQLPNGQISQNTTTDKTPGEIGSFIFNGTAKRIEFGNIAVQKGKNIIIDILNNFLKETDF